MYLQGSTRKQSIQSNLAPTTGTWNVGDHAQNTTSVVGQPKGWYCTVAGTGGTLTGTTGGITTATKSLEVSTAAGLAEGTYITIVGVTKV